MSDTSHAVAPPHTEAHHSAGAALRFFVIALTAFLTVVDLFATQAILPSLTKHYGVTRHRWALPSMPARWVWPFRAWPSAISVARSIAGKAS